MTEDFLATNRATWDGKVAPHLVAYGAEEFAADPSAMSSIVLRDAELMRPHLPGGSVAGLSLLHLQCHIGTDSLTWARLGAEVTGLDFSGEAVRAARGLAARAGLDATFVESTVDDAPAALGGRQFDVVYTSIGAITWLPDLRSWADVIVACLARGGLFYIRDGHPMLMAIDYDRDDELLVITRPYFGSGVPERSDDGLTYASEESDSGSSTTYEWAHSLSDIITSLLAAGLELVDFQEHSDIPWRALPQMIENERGFALPAGQERVPLTFSLSARRPR